ncbi:PREDICTED: tripartite motif-containing protein 2-like [Branchiostoma belcheri]|uniref:Tripartite motif-containing protein 2-like n=1 Tax=Branchiostoma belcheri TaxID=7741 RepID=A0A6P5AH47_BRABE|nr:PREDICTED: tripartite motif-containing protein 2-like [Branchiostoma belcheri]
MFWRKTTKDDKKKDEDEEKEVKMVKFGGRGSRRNQFCSPTGVAVSETSELFVADSFNERIVVCNTRGKVVRAFNTVTKGKHFRPRDLSVDKDGNLWVVGTVFMVEKKAYVCQNLLTQFSTEGRFLTKIDLPLTGVTSGIATRADIGHVRVQDQSTGKAASKKKKKGGEPKKEEEENDGLEQYTNAVEIVVTDQRTRMVERKGYSESCVKVVTPDGTQVKVVGPRNTRKPTGVAVNQKGDLYVTDSWLHCVHVFMEGRDVTKKYKKFGGFGSGDGQLDSPHGICLDRQGNVIVVDRGNWRVSVFDRDGKFVRHIMNDVPDLYSVAAGPNFVVVTCVGHCGTDTATIIPYSSDK